MQIARLALIPILLFGPVWLACWLSCLVRKWVFEWFHFPLLVTIIVPLSLVMGLGIILLKTFVEEWAKNHDDSNGYD